MKDKYRASAVFHELYEAMRLQGDFQGDMPGTVAYQVGKSRQTIRQYACEPDSKSFRVPPISVLDAMRERIMYEDVFRPSVLRNLTLESGYKVARVTLADYESALDLSDSLVGFPVTAQVDTVIPVLSDDARLRHQWRQVYFSGTVRRADLAILAGVDLYDVAWVGREHAKFGIQPSAEMVAKAMALEALSGR